MKKRILVLTFADHLTDEQVQAIAQTHKNATGLYAGAELGEHDFSPVIPDFPTRDLITDEPVFESDPVTEMSKHFAPDVWEKIVKNYDPFYVFRSGQTLKQACELKPKPSNFALTAFIWEDSPEGEEYWSELHDSL